MIGILLFEGDDLVTEQFDHSILEGKSAAEILKGPSVQKQIEEIYVTQMTIISLLLRLGITQEDIDTARTISRSQFDQFKAERFDAELDAVEKKLPALGKIIRAMRAQDDDPTDAE